MSRSSKQDKTAEEAAKSSNGRKEKKKDGKKKRNREASTSTAEATEPGKNPATPSSKPPKPKRPKTVGPEYSGKTNPEPKETSKSPTVEGSRKKTTKTGKGKQREGPKSREVTQVRLSEEVKKTLVQGDSTIWIGISKRVTTNRFSSCTALDAFVRKELRGLIGLDEVTKIASSFIIATFDETSQREAGINKLKKSIFKVDGQVLPLIVVPFGKQISESDRIWHLPAPQTTWEEIESAVVRTFKAAKQELPGFQARREKQNDILNGTWLLKFDKAPTFIKQITSKEGIVWRASTDPKNVCRYCKQADGHTSWDCDGKNSTTTVSSEERHKFTHVQEVEMDEEEDEVSESEPTT